jgi:hypothetical protein
VACGFPVPVGASARQAGDIQWDQRKPILATCWFGWAPSLPVSSLEVFSGLTEDIYGQYYLKGYWESARNLTLFFP